MFKETSDRLLLGIQSETQVLFSIVTRKRGTVRKMAAGRSIVVCSAGGCPRSAVSPAFNTRNSHSTQVLPPQGLKL